VPSLFFASPSRHVVPSLRASPSPPRAEFAPPDPHLRNPRAESTVRPLHGESRSESAPPHPRHRNHRTESALPHPRHRNHPTESAPPHPRQRRQSTETMTSHSPCTAMTRAGDALQGPLARQTSAAREHALAWLSPRPRHQDGTVIPQTLLCPTEHCSRWSPNLSRFRVQDSAPTTEC